MLKITTVVAVVFSFIACEDDFETIGGSVIGGPGFTAELYDEAQISAETNVLEPVQTNNLPVNLLGVYKDPVFGTQVANILSQVEMSQADPTFGNEPVIDSVILTIPYFSTEEFNDLGESDYELDSIYGSSPIRISVVETNFFLNQYDPATNFEQSQRYYSNLGPRIEENLTTNVLFEDDFSPSPVPFVEYPPNSSGVADTVVSAPAMRLSLSPEFFQTKIIDKEGSSDLLNQNNFRDYFRSIYIKAEPIGGNGHLMMLDLAQDGAGITIYYKNQSADTGDEDGDDDTTELVPTRRSYKLDFTGTRVNTFHQDTTEFSDDENLFLKGGEGSMAIIDLFSGPDSDGDKVSDELQALRENDWLINEANLEFFVNRDYMNGLDEPERLYVYDLDNNIRLADYVLDAQGQFNAMNSRSNTGHLGPLTKSENGEGISYKLKITRHINNVVNNDSTNVRLGLVVSQNVNAIRSAAVLQTDDAEVRSVPAGSVVSPKGTVLYGPDAANDEKRLKLRIYYTEPNN